MKYRPKDIYPEHTEAECRAFIKQHDLVPVGFRIPKQGEYYICCSMESRSKVPSYGASFHCIQANAHFAPIGPRIIVKWGH